MNIGRLIVNDGFAFGLGSGLFPPVFYLVVCALLLGLILMEKLKGLGWWLILLGGFINGLDRLLTGAVSDYWGVPFLNLWFNFPDLLITMGVVWLILI